MLIFDGTNKYTYDSFGRPTSIGDTQLEWYKDGSLKSLVNNKFVEYFYNEEGIRYKKIIDNKEICYIIDGNKILKEKSNDYEIIYYYSLNKLIGFRYNGDEFIYERDLFGNINRIYNSIGELVGEYLYDSYGNCKIITDIDNIATINPFRYRGYYFDKESDLYYCNARYYNPSICRWVSMDSIKYLDSNNFNGLNLYAYCNNNPIMNVDPDGTFAFLALTAIIGAVIGAVAAGVTSYQHGARGWEVVGWSAAGAVGGGVLGAAVGAGASVLLAGKATASITAVYHGLQGAAWAYTLGGTGGLVGFISYNLGYNSNYFPANDGFATISQVTLEPGQYLQRIGGEGGRFVSPYFTDPFSLSLPYDKLSLMNNISVYQVVSPITANAGPAVPFFGQYGGGIQYDLVKTIAKLIEEGILRRL